VYDQTTIITRMIYSLFGYYYTAVN